MINKILIDIRDYCYFSENSQDGEVHGFYGYRFRFELILISFYINILIIIIYSYRIIYNDTFTFEPYVYNKTFLKFMLGVIFYLPYYLFISYLINKLKVYPLPQTMTINDYTRKRNKANIILFIGLITIGVTIYCMEIIVRYS